MIEAVLKDWKTAPISDKMKAALEFLTKFVPPENDFGKEDLVKLEEAGMSKEAIEDLMYASWCFQNLSRWMDAFGFPVLSESKLSLTGKFLWSKGYG